VPEPRGEGEVRQESFAAAGHDGGITTATSTIATTSAATNTQTNTQTAVLCSTSGRYRHWLQTR
jgi:hypothetical protein